MQDRGPDTANDDAVYVALEQTAEWVRIAESGWLPKKFLVAVTAEDLANAALNAANAALNAAAQAGDLEAAKAARAGGASLDTRRPNDISAAMFAADNGHDEVLGYSLDEGTKASYAKADGWTALFFAAQKGHVKCVELLLAKDADILQAAKNGATPLALAAQAGHKAVLALFFAKLPEGAATVANAKIKWLTLHFAATSCGDADIVEWVRLQHPEAAHALDSQGMLPLLRAARANPNFAVVELLLEHSEPG